MPNGGEAGAKKASNTMKARWAVLQGRASFIAGQKFTHRFREAEAIKRGHASYIHGPKQIGGGVGQHLRQLSGIHRATRQKHMTLHGLHQFSKHTTRRKRKK